MPKGATGRTPDGDQMKGNLVRWHFGPRRLEGTGGVTLTNAKGSQVTADRLNWTMRDGKVEADGNVTLTEEGTRVTGQRLRADIKLKRGRLSGRTRVVMTGSGLKKKTP
jgi:lipopolysaccharide assembly outer membrane protein LptD (OstA)